MLVVIEGPDRSGKTSLWRSLHGCVDATFVPALPVSEELLPHMYHVERRQLALWEALHDPAKLYICDRHAVVSGPVYAAAYGRQSIVASRRWIRRCHILYIAVPPSILMERHCAEGTMFLDVRAQYAVALEKFRHTTLDGCLSPDSLRDAALEVIRYVT